MNKKNVNRKDLSGKWTVGLVILAGLSVSAVWGQERWKTYVKGPGATYVVGCLYNVPQKVVTVGASAGSVDLAVETHGSCPWSVSSAASWLSVAKQGNNTARISFGSLDANEPPRCADVVIAGCTVRLQQDGAAATGVNVSPLALTIEGQGGYALQGIHVIPVGSAVRTASTGGVPDTWLSVLSGCSFTAETWVLIEAEPNRTGKTRVGSVQVGGRWVAVTQPPLE